MADYTKTSWVDDDGSGTTGTALTAARLNSLESGVQDAAQHNKTGTLAARPAAATGNKNWTYFATDTGQLAISDGSTWRSVGVGFRQTATITTASLGVGSIESSTVSLSEGFRVLRVTTDRPARVRLYTTPAKRTADLTRAAGVTPTGDHGLVLDVVTTASVLALDLSPIPEGFSMETTPVDSIAYATTNLDSSPAVVVATLVWQKQEDL